MKTLSEGPTWGPAGAGVAARDPNRRVGLRCAPLTCTDAARGRSWDQVGGEKRAPDLVPLPRQDQEGGAGQRGAAQAVGSELERECLG